MVTMKKSIGFVVMVSLLMISCSEDSNCFSRKGDAISQTAVLSSFDEIDIPMHTRVQLVPSNEYKMEIHSYENFIGHIEYSVLNKRLVITNDFSCTMLHSSETAFLKIYSPNIKSIDSKTQFEVFSKDTLHYPELRLKTSFPSESASTHFNLLVDNEYIYTEDNQVAKFELKGKTNVLDIKLFGANGIVEARNLKADTIYFYHRSNQNIHVFPLKYLEGTIGSIGNVYCYNRPDSLKINKLYKGGLIFKVDLNNNLLN